MKTLFAMSVLVVSTAVCDAELILQPDDLNPGDQYRLLFTTSQFIDGTSSDISVYNDFVQRVADEAPIVGQWDLEWKAIVSTSADHAVDNADLRFEDEADGVPIYRVDGSFLGPNDKWFFPNFDGGGISLSYNITELETVIERDPPNKFFSGTPVWIGTGSQGQVTAPLGGATAVAEDLSAFWGQGPGLATDLELPLLAISETLTAVSEPSSVALLGLALVPLGMLRRRH